METAADFAVWREAQRPRADPTMSWTEIIFPEPCAVAAPVKQATLGPFEVCWVCLSSPARADGEDSAFLGAEGEQGLIGFAIDGMGGMASGAKVARLSATTIAEELARPTDLGSPIQRAIRAVRQAHAQVLERYPGGGATIAGAVICGDRVQTLHSGDAEVMILASDGTCRYRTPAHSPVGRALQRGLIEEEQALAHPERHLVSNGLGVASMSVHLGPRMDLRRGDTALIATDGVTDNVRQSEVVDCLRSGPLPAATARLTDLCSERMRRSMTSRSRSHQLGKADDMTLLAIRQTGR